MDHSCSYLGLCSQNVTAKMSFEIPNGKTILCCLKTTHCESKICSLWVYQLWIPPAKQIHLFTGSSGLANVVGWTWVDGQTFRLMTQDHEVSVMPTQQLEGKWLRQLVWSSFHPDKVFTWKYFWKVNCHTNSNCTYYSYWKLIARKSFPHKDHCWIQALYINEAHLLAMYITKNAGLKPSEDVTELITQTFFMGILEGTARPD